MINSMVKRSTQRRWWSPRNVVPVALVLALVAIGPVLDGSNLFFALILAGMWAPAVLGMSLLVGWSGQISLGQGAVAALGAYSAGYFAVNLGWDPLSTIGAALVVVAVVAIAVSSILRVRGYYFAMVTLAIGIVVYQLALLLEPLTGGSLGMIGIPTLSVLGFEFTSGMSFYVLVWCITAVVVVGLAVLISGRYGRALRTLGEDEKLAFSFGVPVARYKAYAWVISAVLAGLSGAVYAYYNQFLSPGQFTVARSIELIAAVMLINPKSLTGSIIGTVVIFAGPELLGVPSEYSLIAAAIILIGAAIIPHLHWGGLRRATMRMFARTASTNSGGPTESEQQGLPLDAPASVASGQPSETTTSVMVRTADEASSHGKPQFGDTILEIRDLRKSFGGRTVLDGASFTVAEGSIQGLIGPNGAGKSTMLNLLTGGDTVDGGKLIFAGEDITGMAPDILARNGLVRTFQHPRLLHDMTVIENVVLGAYSRVNYAIPMMYVNPGKVAKAETQLWEASLEALELLGVANLAYQRAAELTVGQRRLVATAQAVAASPRVLCLDEPGAGLNPKETEVLGDCLRRIRDMGLTIVLVEHDMDLVMKLCDRVAVLFQGEIMVNDVPQLVTERSDVADAYLGVAT